MLNAYSILIYDKTVCTETAPLLFYKAFTQQSVQILTAPNTNSVKATKVLER